MSRSTPDWLYREIRRRPSHRMEYLRGNWRQDRGRHLGGSTNGPANRPLYRMVSVAAAMTVTSPRLRPRAQQTPTTETKLRGHERLGGTTTQGSWRWLRRAQALDAALDDK